MKTRCLAIACALLTASTAKSEFIINMTEVGNDVVAIGSGTLNIIELSKIEGTGIVEPYLSPHTPAINIGAPSLIETDLDIYRGVNRGPLDFGAYGSSVASFGTGDFFSFDSFDIQLIKGYTSGSMLSSTATWSNDSFVTLGLTPGSYTWSWGSGSNADFIQLNIITAVPEPSAAILVGLSALALSCRWNRN